MSGCSCFVTIYSILCVRMFAGGYMTVHQSCAVPAGAREGARFPGTGVRAESLCGYREFDPHPLQEQVRLTTELSLQPLIRAYFL